MLKFMQRLGIAVLALAIPALAQAAPQLNLGSNTDIYPGLVYEFEDSGDLTAGSYSYLFPITTYGSPGTAITANIGLGDKPALFTGGVFEIVGTSGAHTGVTIGTTTLFVQTFGIFAAVLENIPFLLGEKYDVKMGFTLNGDAHTQLSVSLSTVPLPAAAWLILAGVGGLGLVARRRKMAEAA